MTPAGTAVMATSDTTPLPSGVAARNLLSPNQMAIAIPVMMHSA